MMMGETRWRYQGQADQFLRTAQGQWALRHGCGRALWEHVAEFSSYPSRSEIQRIYEAVQRNQARSDAGELNSAFQAMWDHRLLVESRLANQFLQAAA